MKRVILSSIAFILILIVAVLTLKMNNSLAYGCDIEIVNNNGTLQLLYFDEDTGYQITPQTAVNYYEDVSAYDSYEYNNKWYYFHYGKQISESEFNRGMETERADYLAKQYGKNAYRVHNTNEVKRAFDDIYSKLRYGEFVIVFSDYDYAAIDWNAVKSYYNSKYALNPYNINYYTYDYYGEYMAYRWGFDWDLSRAKTDSMLYVRTTAQIRLTGNQRQVLTKMGDLIVSKITNGIPSSNKEESDYYKIMRAFNYIKNIGAAYDTNFYENLLDGSTSAYSVFLEDSSVCIGNAVAFSYLMKRLGINSYIVDNISYIDRNSKSIETSHSYNLVELGGKYYVIDIGSRFLQGVRSGELKGATLSNASSSAYNTRGKPTTWSISKSEINSMKSQAKQVQTTTSKRAYTTTTYKPTTKVKSNEVTVKTTTKTTTKGKTTTGVSIPGTVKTTTEKKTTVQTFYNTDLTSKSSSKKTKKTVTIIYTTTKKGDKTTSEAINPETDKGILFNWTKETIAALVVGIGILLISILLIIRSKNKVRYKL